MATDTKEVTRMNLTLEQAIGTGAVPKPPLMGWNTWLAWRKKTGGRPHQSTDGAGTSQKFEAKLWRATMLSLYGEEWDVELFERGGPEPSAYTQADEAEAAEQGAEQRAGAVSAPAALAPPRTPTPGAKSPGGSARSGGGRMIEQ